MAGNTTVVVVISDHLDVAVLSPPGSPGVLDNPVVFIAGSIVAVTNNQDSVVKTCGAAGGLVVDSTLITREGRSSGINSNGDGTNSADCLLQNLFIISLYVDISCDLSGVVGRVVAASVLPGIIRIRGLSINATIGLDIFERVLLPASLAAIIPVRCSAAVNEVLLREGHESLGLAEPLSFERASGGEGPARPALSLVFDGGYGPILTPINGFWYGLGIRWDESFTSAVGGHLETVVHRAVLRIGQVGKVVDALFVMDFASLEEFIVCVDSS